MGQGQGFGKTILFGEHFVVYGLPSIASALGSKTMAKVTRIKGKGYGLVDDRPETPGYKKEKAGQQAQSIKNIFKACGIDPARNPVRITLSGDLVAASGVGASAASCVAIARALNQEFSLGFDDNRINEVAYEGEKGYHGTPSGIDNTCSTFGGLIWFTKKANGNSMEKLRMKNPVEIILANSGLTSDTSAVVGDVKRQKEAYPERFGRIFSDYKTLAGEARKAVERHDLQAMGRLMDRNQGLLQEITVSCDELDTLVSLAKANGAMGAKLTGTGRGGLVVALTPGKALQEKVARAIEEEGFSVMRTAI